MARTLRIIGTTGLTGTVQALLLDSSYTTIDTITLTEVSTGVWTGTIDAGTGAGEYLVRMTDDNGMQGIWEVVTITAADGTTFTVRDSDNLSSILGSSIAATNLKQSLLATTTGTVVDDASNTASTFQVDTTLGAKAADYFGDDDGGSVLAFVNGTTNEFQARRVVSFDTDTDFITVEAAFASEPTAGDAFVLLGRITELS